jgi:hypothetical protein
MKTTLAREINNNLREGLAIKYAARKMGKKIKRKVSEVRSMFTSDVRGS